MIRINGISLDQPDKGWTLLPETEPFAGFESRVDRIDVSGRDGTVPVLGTMSPTILKARVLCLVGALPALRALVTSQSIVLTRDDQPNVQATARFMSSSVDRAGVAADWLDLTFVFEIPGAFWRSKTERTDSLALTSASVSGQVMPGSTAPVQDAVIRVIGDVSGLTIRDSSGAWVTFPNNVDGRYTRFEAATGRCFVAASNTWAGGTEVSGQCSFGGPRGVFEIVPVLNASTLASAGSLTATSTSRSSNAQVQVRARTAHAI